MILSVKEVMLLLGCSKKTAQHHLCIIRMQQNTTLVTKWHMADYLCIDFLALEASFQVKVNGNYELAAKIITLRDKERAEEAVGQG